MKNFSVTIVSANELSAVEMLTSNLVKGQTATITMSEKDGSVFMNKRNNPYLGRVEKVTIYHGWQVGTNYEKSCNNSAKRSGSEEKVKTKENWHVYYNPFFETDKKSGTKFYLQLQMTETMSSYTETKYYLDGQPISKSVIENWLKKKSISQSSSQKEAGITEENARWYNTITLSKIDEIVQGDFRYTIVKEKETARETAAAK